MIYGNKEGVRDSLLAKLETLYDLDLTSEVFAPAELLDVLAAFTCAMGGSSTRTASAVRSASMFPEAALYWISPSATLEPWSSRTCICAAIRAG